MEFAQTVVNDVRNQIGLFVKRGRVKVKMPGNPGNLACALPLSQNLSLSQRSCGIPRLCGAGALACVFAFLVFFALALASFGPGALAQDTTAPPVAKPAPAEVREQSASRDANTRVWENVYRTPILDPVTGQPTGQTTETLERYFEKGTNICYDSRENPADPSAPAPQWQPTDIKIEPCGAGFQPASSPSGTGAPAGDSSQSSSGADASSAQDPLASGFAYQVIRGPVKAYFKASPAAADANVRLAPRGQAPIDAQILGLVYYDPATGSTRAVDAIRNVAPRAEGNRLIYPGAFACGSLEYIYTNLGVEQDVVIEHPEALPDPALVGFDPATAQLLVVSNIKPADPSIKAKILGPSDSLSSAAASAASSSGTDASSQPAQDLGTTAVLSPDLRAADLSDLSKSRIKGKNLSIQIEKCGADASSVQIGEFAPGSAWDASTTSPAKTDLYKVIERADAQGNISLKEGISLAYLRASERQFPVRIDWTYASKTGTQTLAKETWAKGLTYYISGTFTVPSGSKLSIEPGAIIKGAISLNPAISISAGGTFLCQGTAYEPISFVPSNVTTIGASVGGTGAPNTYVNSSSNNSYFEFVKFSGGSTAINLSTPYAYDTNSDIPQIAHCVFKNQTWIPLVIGTSGTAWELTIFNCLFDMGSGPAGYAISSGSIGSYNCLIEIANCTFVSSYSFLFSAINIPGSKDNTKYHIVNNIFKLGNAPGGTCIDGRTSANGAQTGVIRNNRYDNMPNFILGISSRTGLTISANTQVATTFYSLSQDSFSNPTNNGTCYPEKFTNLALGTNFRNQGADYSSYVTEVAETNLTSSFLNSLRKMSIVRPLRIGVSGDFNINAFDGNGNPSAEGAAITSSSHLDLMPDNEALPDNQNMTDIGYHYPLVHGVMGNFNILCMRDISLLPGTIVASAGSSSVFTLDGPVSLSFKAIGTPSNYIRFIDYAQAGDDPTRTGNIFAAVSGSCANNYFNIDVREMKPQGIQFQYCILEHANTAIRIFGASATNYYNQWTRPIISDSIFRYNGIWTNALEAGVQVSYCDADVTNCLFENNRAGVYVNNSGVISSTAIYQPNIIGCTFNGGKYGVYLYPGSVIMGTGSGAYQDHTYATIQDCIFANQVDDGSNDVGSIYIYGNSAVTNTTSHFTGIIRKNMFWNNRAHIFDDDPNGSVNLATYQVSGYSQTNIPDSDSVDSPCPMFVNASSQDPTTYEWRYDEEPGYKYLLAQNSTDASREPLITGRITGLNRGTVDSRINITIYGDTAMAGGSYYQIPSPDSPALTSTYQKCSLTGSTFATGLNTNICYNQLVIYNSGAGFTISGNQIFTITFLSRNGSTGQTSTIKCRLPNIDIGSALYAQFWIAQDGSLYWATNSKASSAFLFSPANVDIFSALHHDFATAASIAFSGQPADRSPAIDAGTSDYISGGATSTQYLFASQETQPQYADHVLPKYYRTGYIHRTEYGEDSNLDADQAMELAKGLDLGFHYGGQSQKFAPISNPTPAATPEAYTTLAPAIRLAPKTEPLVFFTTEENQAQTYQIPNANSPTSVPDITVAAYGSSDFTNNEVTLAAATTSNYAFTDPLDPNHTADVWQTPPVSRLQVYEPGRMKSWFKLVDWNLLDWYARSFDYSQNPPVVMTSSLIPVILGHISSVDSLTIPSDVSNAGSKFLASNITFFNHIADNQLHQYSKNYSSMYLYLYRLTGNSNMISNGAFDDSSNWTWQSWSFDGANKRASLTISSGSTQLSHATTAVSGRIYRLTYTFNPSVTGDSAKTVKCSLGGAEQELSAGSDQVLYLHADNITPNLVFTGYANASYSATLDNVTLAEVTLQSLQRTISAGSVCNMDGSVALANDGNGDVHLFWTEPYLDGGATKYGLFHAKYTCSSNTIGTPARITTGIGASGLAVPDDHFSEYFPPYYNYSPTWIEPANPNHTIAAAYDGDANCIRLVWTEPSGNNALIVTGRWVLNYPETVDPVLQLSQTAQSINARRVNSIAFADFSNAVPSWLKSSGLKMEDFISSDNGTWRCIVNGASDDWSTGELLRSEMTQGSAFATVAARGFRIPRYAGKGSGLVTGALSQDLSVLMDGIVAIGRGRQALIKTNPGNFIDQYLTTQVSSPDTTDEDIPRDAPIAVLPLRP